MTAGTPIFFKLVQMSNNYTQPWTVFEKDLYVRKMLNSLQLLKTGVNIQEI